MKRSWIGLVLFLMLFSLAGCSTSEIICDLQVEDLQVVELSDGTVPERITVGELEGLFDYDIYYCGVRNFYVELNGERLELRAALKKDPAAAVEAVLAQAEQDAGAGLCAYELYKDGGTRSYQYESHKLYKQNAMTSFSLGDGEMRNGATKDLLIGAPEMNYSEALGQIRELWPVKLGWDDAETGYVYRDSADLVQPLLVLGADGRFRFVWSAFSSYLAMGSYTRSVDELTLKTDDGKYTLVFKEQGETLLFCEEKSTPLPRYRYLSGGEPRTPVPDGAVFTKQ